MIAGAYLTCRPVAIGANCDTRNDLGQLTDFGISKAYLINGKDLEWKEVTFQRLGTGRYHVDIPTTVQGAYAVGMINSDQEQPADWVVFPPESLVKDGSFELFGGDVGGANVILASTEFWKAEVPQQNAQCDVAYIEIVKVGDKPPAGQIEVTDGTHILDVNTSCDGVTGTTANNAIIFQTISVKAGHMYQWIYDARKNPASALRFVIPSSPHGASFRF